MGPSIVALSHMVPVFTGKGRRKSVFEFVDALEQVAKMGRVLVVYMLSVVKCRVARDIQVISLIEGFTQNSTTLISYAFLMPRKSRVRMYALMQQECRKLGGHKLHRDLP